MSETTFALPRTDTPVRSLFAPVVMVAAGFVFLLVNVGTLSPRGVFVAFARFWPLLLIVWGVVRLAEHVYARYRGRTAAGLGFGGVVLMILFIGVGSAASAFHRHSEHVNWAALREEMNVREDGPGPLLGRRFEYTATADYDVPAGAIVKVRVNRGALRIVPSADGRIHARMRKLVLAYDEADAAAIEARVQPEILTSAGALVIDASRRSQWAGARLELELEVPPKAVLDLASNRGRVDVHGREAAVRVDVSHATATLEDVQGAVDARLHHAGLVARDVRGDVSLDGRIDETVLSRIEGAVSLRGSLHGDIRADHVSGGLRIASSRVDMLIPRLEGEVFAGEGRVRVHAATGPLRVKTHSQEIDVAAVKGDVKLENRNGEIALELDPRAPVGNVDVSSRSGSVRLRLPAQAGFAVDARTDKGEITSDFELATTQDKDRLQATGIVNKGGPKVTVLVENGTIHLRRN